MFMPAGTESNTEVYLQVRQGQFVPKAQPAFKSGNYDDADAAIFDANGDGKNDHVAHGGYGSLEENDPQLQDRLYLNEAKVHSSKVSPYEIAGQ